MVSCEEIKEYFKNSYELLANPEEAYQYNYGYMEGCKDAGGLTKDEYNDLTNCNNTLLKKEVENNES